MMEHKTAVRPELGYYMTTLGDKNDKVVIVNADLAGTCRNKGFEEKYPNRCFNVGIAEQNMVSFGAGLACEGYIPYVFSMAPFLTMRACEQCRTDVAYGNRNVRMIGIYAGVSGGISGATHWSIEDCGIMTSIPNVAVFEVSDVNQMKRLMDYSLEYSGPMYIRCTVESTLDIYPENVSIIKGGSQTVIEGNDGAFLCSGVIVQYAIEASKTIFEETGKRIRVIDMYSIKPVDKEAVISAARTGNVIVAQDHNVYGGLGSIVGTVIAEEGLSTKFKICGINDEFVAMAHAGYLYHHFGIDGEGLKNSMLEMLDK